jgi:glycosyltransferase involved in cell wall biosynthesis
MRIAFYAPLKSPGHAVPSGDRRVGRLLVDALRHAGHMVELASTLRTYDPAGDHARQVRLREESLEVARNLVAKWREGRLEDQPDIWFTYHVYHKAPDWLGPYVASELGIPYVIAEASYAPKRASGPWALGHEAAASAIHSASVVLCPIRFDIPCVQPLLAPNSQVVFMPPFLNPAPYESARTGREPHRARLAMEHNLDPEVPWITVAAMMRPGDKVASYLELAATLRQLIDLPWHFVVVGDGDGRAVVEAALNSAAPGRCCFLGERDAEEVADIYAACDLCIWPAVNEAYGMAMLEAQAAGLPVVSRADRGVPDVVNHGHTGLLASRDQPQDLVVYSRMLLSDAARRREMGLEAARFVSVERSVAAASVRLHAVLTEHCSPASVPSAATGQ